MLQQISRRVEQTTPHHNTSHPIQSHHITLHHTAYHTGEVTSDRGKVSLSALTPFALSGRLVLIAFKPSGRGKDRVLENAPLGSESGLPGWPLPNPMLELRHLAAAVAAAAVSFTVMMAQ